MVYHYFIQVVPTIVKTRFKSYLTYQYSVRELAREINHDQGSHGVSVSTAETIRPFSCEIVCR